ncbi:lytic transglycosylase domain-containing protein [Helicobacter sp. 13S00477-4]|uniref:lytic transglycosylase domain-containing protein n=1 Tax=Helicobacter sp. 13S00477-4 TaxID=1905759 RepID=UPI000BA737CA|nr:lytic transglycosylase domain-containing protein [Helicobacter sp. 13S00477-4]PAF50632.1 lytic murein transglycosylase [Helicobacter sp. 13S00477-4]
MKKIIIFICLVCFLSGKSITLKFIQDKPEGIVRDFYIWQYISDEKTTIEQAKKAYELVFNKTPRIQKAMETKGVITEMPKDIFCKNLNFEELINEDGECLSYGLKLSDIFKFSTKDIDSILNKVKPINPSLFEQIKILHSKNVLESMLQTSAKNFGMIFNGLTYLQKLELLNKSIPHKKLENLANQNNVIFNKMLHTIILDSRFELFKKSLSKANITKSDTNTFFLLGINQILNHNDKKALLYFQRSQNAAIDPFMRDRALFWQYLISQNKTVLKQLSDSIFVDIFSIYANQKLQTKPKYQIISAFDNISSKNPDFNIKDPFEWQILRDNIFAVKDDGEYKKILQYFEYEKTLPHLVYFLNRATKYQVNYFITPYKKLMSSMDDDEKSMVYAIARQESHLLPALISRSYALGIMQIMPFNVLPFAKEMNLKNIELSDMFDPKIALKFGNHYLNSLKEEFQHPLFVSYAYNGGPGFLRRLLAKNELFLKGRKYEPWLSMELLPYEESRFYGMKVMANYIIYEDLFGRKINIEKFLEKTLIYTKDKK